VDLMGFSEGTTNNWFIRHLNFCREECIVCIESQSRTIGGYGCTGEIDDSKFVNQKYHKGKARKCNDWILGGICRETGECFMRIVFCNL